MDPDRKERLQFYEKLFGKGAVIHTTILNDRYRLIWFTKLAPSILWKCRSKYPISRRKGEYSGAGKILEHRLVWVLHYGPIPAGYVIHHINGDMLDNRIENLMMLLPSIHTRIHSHMELFSEPQPINWGAA